MGWRKPDAPVEGRKRPRREDYVLQIHRPPGWAAVANVAREGRSPMRQHHPYLVEAARVKLDEQVTLVGDIRHRSGQSHVQKRRLAACTDDPRGRAVDPQVRFVSPDELLGLRKRERDLGDIPLVPATRGNLLRIVGRGLGRAGHEHQSAGRRVQPVHQTQARESLRRETMHERVGTRIAREFAGQAGRLQRDDFVRRDV